MSLGCRRSDVLLLILSSGARRAAVGCAVGVLGEVATSRLLHSFLLDVSQFDPAVLTLSAAAMLLVALGASALPAKRASGVNPMLALRGD